ncbi:MAG: META domain-containing protein [Alphaproteobacteria bacterium HGW-Alphaproteobacteria-2]|nr:MAG: META domain-containing protein [Alphaproteobacteria bacterium HGW-Alphaproteobacteria-2]
MPARAALLPLLLGLSFCAPDETVSGYAGAGSVWRLEEMAGLPAPARVTLGFPAEGRIEGQGPCNAYRGRQTVPYPWFQATDIAATKRACPDLAAEAGYLSLLGEMTLAEVMGDVLILSDETGRTLVFRRLGG